MKKIWARIGMSSEVTDEEYEDLKKLAMHNGRLDDLNDTDFPDWLIEKFKNKAIMDGESYIPQIVFEDLEMNTKPYGCYTCAHTDFSKTCCKCTDLDHWEPIC